MNSDNTFFKYMLRVALGTGALLLIPLIAMQFTNEVAWTLGDFVFAAVLLFGTGTAFAFAVTRPTTFTYKMGMGIVLVSAFLLVWLNGAVGIVGHEGEPINMLYFFVLGIGAIGAFLTRFRSKGMLYTISAMLAALIIITVVALLGYMQEPPHNSALQIIGVNAFFLVLFSLSAISFRHAAKDELDHQAAS